MVRLPRSLLARTFFTVAALVLLTTTAWLTLFRIVEAEPRARETAQLAASAVNLIRAALIAAAPDRRPQLFMELTSREGIRLLPAESDDEVENLPNNRYFDLVKSEVAERLGTSTRLALAVNGIPGFWVSFRLADQDDDEYWLILPRERAERSLARHWLLWGALALFLALVVAGFMASRITRPLKAMAKAASSVGRGQHPEPLAEEGAEELRQLAATFNRMAADLASHEQNRSEVLAGISHDLRTPLTRLRLEAEMSLSDPAAREAVVADLEQMESVITQFMDYARGDRGEASEVTEPSTLLRAIADRQATLGHPLVADIPELPAMALKARTLSRAVTNLIDNARKYADSDITLAASIVSGELHIDVRDRGPGIPPEECERLKRPFTRLDTARSNATGTGLGLAIVNRVADLHGGRLELLPNPEGGLIARLALPLKR